MGTVLIVEDEYKIRQIFKRWLAFKGYTVREAANALEARERLQSGDIDVVLLDLKMPEVTGGELSTLIRSFHPGVRILVASVYPIEQQRRIVSDADGYYDKADGYQKLLDNLEIILERHRAESVSHQAGYFSRHHQH